MHDVVCLSDSYDLHDIFRADFARLAPDLQLLRPDQVSDPGSVVYALAFDPAPDAFVRFTGLKLICAWGAGVDGLLRHPALPDVPIKRMVDPDQARMMAAFAAYHLTGWQRRMWDYPELQTARDWRALNWTAPPGFPVGLLGYGKMGEAIAQGLSALGFPVTAWASRARQTPGATVLSGAEGLARVLSDSAAVINVLPLTPDTAGILNADRFAQMRDDAILIQLARGDHVVEPDLIAALDAGRPALAALDVTAIEPLPADSPLWTHPKVRITPHVASTSGRAGVVRSVQDGIAAIEAGRVPEGVVDRRRGY